jgi:hypothetical protein
MITAYPGNQAPPDGKHVTSMAPGGPRDLSASLARHRARSEGPTTVPPGGWPVTSGRDPDSPDVPAEPGPGEVLTSPTQDVSPESAWRPKASAGEYTGY